MVVSLIIPNPKPTSQPKSAFNVFVYFFFFFFCPLCLFSLFVSVDPRVAAPLMRDLKFGGPQFKARASWISVDCWQVLPTSHIGDTCGFVRV
jgi:hypothetical protein